jgi:hypothetical protein
MVAQRLFSCAVESFCADTLFHPEATSKMRNARKVKFFKAEVLVSK